MVILSVVVVGVAAFVWGALRILGVDARGEPRAQRERPTKKPAGATDRKQSILDRWFPETTAVESTQVRSVFPADKSDPVQLREDLAVSLESDRSSAARRLVITIFLVGAAFAAVIAVVVFVISRLLSLVVS